MIGCRGYRFLWRSTTAKTNVVYLTNKMVSGGIYDCNTQNVGWQMLRQERTEKRGCDGVSYLDSTADTQDEGEKMLLTSVNTELACQVNVFQMHGQRELGKTMQYHSPWL